MSRPKMLVFVLLMFLCNSAACFAGPISINEQMVENITLPGWGDDHDAVFKDKDYAYKGPGEEFYSEYGTIEKIAVGDLNDDGIDDAVFVAWFGVGTGFKNYQLFIVSGKSGKLEICDYIGLGDRIKITALSIKGGKIYLKFKTHKTFIGMASEPTVPVSATFILKNNKIIDINAKTSQKKVQAPASLEAEVGNTLSAQSGLDKLLGDWSGEFRMANSNRKEYNAYVSYHIYKDKSNNKVLFRQTDSLQFVNPSDAFSCSMSNSHVVVYTGEIEEVGDTLRFIQKTIDNPNCGIPETDTYKFDGNLLNIVRADGGKLTSGSLKRR